MFGDGDALDRLSDGAIQALADDLLGDRPKRGSVAGEGAPKIKKGPKWEHLDGVGLNQTLRIEIELPGYFVAAMNQSGFSYREAVQQYLVGKGETWWQPRFMAAIKAKEIEAALKRADGVRVDLPVQSD